MEDFSGKAVAYDAELDRVGGIHFRAGDGNVSELVELYLGFLGTCGSDDLAGWLVCCSLARLCS